MTIWSRKYSFTSLHNIKANRFDLILIWFKLIYLRSIAKQVIPTYINHSRPLIPDGIHLCFWTRFWEERKARPVLICWAPSKDASGTIFIMSLVWRGRGSNPRPPAHGANALFWTRFWEERKARPVLICWAPSKDASGTIFITSLVWRGRGSNPRPPAHGANALTTEPPLRCVKQIYRIGRSLRFCGTEHVLL